jgi:5-methyltetrahydrofolate--homocysteine methyltransferase
MPSIRSVLSQKKVLVSDGAWGTFLVQKGMQPGECPELWCVEHADDVRDIARMYVDAGVDIVMTNSFGGTIYKLEHFGLADRVAELNEAAARLSREAAGDDVIVMASVGPTGKILMMGDVREEELYEAFKAQAIALERGGADAIVVETMSAVDEAVLGVRAAKENTQLEVLVSFTYDTKTPEGYRTMMGVSPKAMAAAFSDAGVDGLGANCSLGSDEMAVVARALHNAAPDKPILVHANAGRPIPHDDGRIEYPETPKMMADNVANLVQAGATIIGGCCGTGPEHIQAIRQAVSAI